MDLQSRKIEFIQEFLKLESADAISKLEVTLKKLNNKFDKKKIDPMSLEELNTRIDRSENDFENDRFISANDLLQQFK